MKTILIILFAPVMAFAQANPPKTLPTTQTPPQVPKGIVRQLPASDQIMTGDGWVKLMDTIISCPKSVMNPNGEVFVHKDKNTYVLNCEHNDSMVTEHELMESQKGLMGAINALTISARACGQPSMPLKPAPKGK